MKKITLLFCLVIATIATAQEKLLSTDGIVQFEASIPLFEEVKAINKKVTCILTTRNNDLICSMFIKDFNFEKSLMQEHFNAYYMESDQYPKAVFKGKIENLNLKNSNSVSKSYRISGDITLHGKTKKINCLASIKKIEEKVMLLATFELNPTDFEIEIPSIVAPKIAKKVQVTINCVLQ
jgi:hypothetical protein